MNSIPLTEIHRYIYEGLKNKHHYYEIMAKWSNPEISANLDHWSNFSSTFHRDSFVIGEGNDRIRVSIYEPKRTTTVTTNPEHIKLQLFKPSPVIAFQGTRINLSDISTDLNTIGVGIDKYCRFEGIIKRIIYRLYKRYGKIVITGFSLGGCYAQYATLRNYKYVNELVTFQSPPISAYFHSLIKNPEIYNLTSRQIKELKDKTKHYLVKNDPIVEAAEMHSTANAYSPGYILEFNFGFGRISYGAHFIQIFSYFITHISNRVRFVHAATLCNCVNFMHRGGAFDHEGEDLPGPQKRLIALRFKEIELNTRSFRDALISYERQAYMGFLIPLRGLSPLEIVYSLLSPSGKDYYYMLLWNTYTYHILKSGEFNFTQLMNFDAPLRFSVTRNSRFFQPKDFLSDDEKRDFKSNLRRFKRTTMRLSETPQGNNPILMDGNGDITVLGIQSLRRKFDIPNSNSNSSDEAKTDDEIRYIYSGLYDSDADYNHWRISDNTLLSNNLQSRWREYLVTKELRLHYEMRSIEFTYRGSRKVIYQSPPGNHPVYMITRRHLSTIIGLLPDIFEHIRHRIPNYSSINFSTIRTRDVFEYLLGSNSANLESAYYRAHSFYIGPTHKDPLGLLNENRIVELFNQITYDRGSSRRIQRSDLSDFNMENFKKIKSLGSTRPSTNHNDKNNLHASFNAPRVAEWYNFLFNGIDGNRGTGFIASSYESGANPESCNSRDQGAFDTSKLRGRKSILRKEPDICLIFPIERTIEIIDPTFRFDIPWHNFKTAVYLSVIISVFPEYPNNPDLNWKFAGYDHRDKRLQVFI